jgi:hypothetical protein
MGVYMTASTDTRLGLARYTTNAFIAEDPITVALNRKLSVRQDDGGHIKQPTTLPSQTFRLINQTATAGPTYSGTDGGATRQFSYVLVGAWDADIQFDDTWTEGDIQYHVDGIEPNNGFETRANVTAFAMEPLHG